MKPTELPSAASSAEEDACALNDAAAHAAVLAEQLGLTISAVRAQYPNNALGGLVDRFGQLSTFAAQHAAALQHVADKALRARPELRHLEASAPIAPPAAILRVFEQADLIEHEISVPEAAQLATKGHLVVLRDRRAQQQHLVPQGAAVFAPEVDRNLVRLWWPRLFSRDMCVALVTTSEPDVWIETTMSEEDLPD